MFFFSQIHHLLYWTYLLLEECRDLGDTIQIHLRPHTVLHRCKGLITMFFSELVSRCLSLSSPFFLFFLVSPTSSSSVFLALFLFFLTVSWTSSSSSELSLSIAPVLLSPVDIFKPSHQRMILLPFLCFKEVFFAPYGHYDYIVCIQYQRVWKPHHIMMTSLC